MIIPNGKEYLYRRKNATKKEKCIVPMLPLRAKTRISWRIWLHFKRIYSKGLFSIDDGLIKRRRVDRIDDMPVHFKGEGGGIDG